MVSLHAEDRSLPSSQSDAAHSHRSVFATRVFPTSPLFKFFPLSLLSVAALIFQSTEDIRIQNTESNSPMFASLRAIRSRSTYFVAIIFITQSVSLRYLSTPFTAHAVFFQTKRSYHGKTVKCAIFPGFCAWKLQTFLSNHMSCFFLYFFYFLRWIWTLRSKFRRLFLFFLSILNVYVNCRLE